MHKGKVLSISFPVKSSKQLAARLGVSKSRTGRISAIIERIAEPKTAAVSLTSGRKSKGQTRNSRTGQRSNARGRRTAKAAR